MRRDINWTTKRDDDTRYEVRITFFSNKFKFQFKERGETRWDYDRQPSPEDLETFLDAIERRYQRKTATYEELEIARALCAASVRGKLPLEDDRSSTPSS